MKISFYLDYQEDLHYIFSRLVSPDPAGLENRIKQKGFDSRFVNDFFKARDKKQKLSILDNYLKKYYLENQIGFEKVKTEYEKIWRKNSNFFFSTTTKIMGGHKWSYETYDFLVSSFFSRAQWGNGNKLAVWWKRSPNKYWYLNGYELILSHVFEVVDQIYKKRPVSDWHLWAIAESVAYILVYREGKLKSFLWPDLEEPKSFSYPQLIKHVNYFENILKKTLNFDNFLKEAVCYITGFNKKEILKFS